MINKKASYQLRVRAARLRKQAAALEKRAGWLDSAKEWLANPRNQAILASVGIGGLTAGGTYALTGLADRQGKNRMLRALAALGIGGTAGLAAYNPLKGSLTDLSNRRAAAKSAQMLAEFEEGQKALAAARAIGVQRGSGNMPASGLAGILGAEKPTKASRRPYSISQEDVLGLNGVSDEEIANPENLEAIAGEAEETRQNYNKANADYLDALARNDDAVARGEEVNPAEVDYFMNQYAQAAEQAQKQLNTSRKILLPGRGRR